MSLFSWLKGSKKEAPAPESPVSQPQNSAFSEPFWQDLFDGRKTTSGESVNWTSAMSVPAALRCGMVIADGVSTVPCKLMRKDPATGRRADATDHQLYWLFERAPSPFQTSQEFRESLILHCVFAGNAYAFINRVRGQIKELIVIPPHAVCVEQNADYSLTYHVTGLDGSIAEVPAEAIWHLRGPSWNGFSGLDTVYHLRNAIGLAMATERAHAARFGNGVQTTGLYSIKGKLDDAAYKRLYGWITKHFVGGANSGKPMILDNEATFTPLEMRGVDAEHVATRQLQIEEICTGFGVKPIMIGHADKSATYASAEQMFLAHAVHTIRPWHRRLESSMKCALLSEDEVKAGYYFKFFDTELLRGDHGSRATFYRQMFEIGMTPNQIAEAEDMDGFADGDAHYRPANLVPITEETNNPPAPAAVPPANQPPTPDQTAAAAQLRMNVGRVLSAQNETLIREASDNLNTVLSKLDAQQPVEGNQ
jgi:HK97 family phage portal protein